MEKGGGRRIFWAVLAAGLAAAVVWVMFVLSQEWWLLGLVAVCVVAAFTSPVMKRRSREAAELIAPYQALYRYLRDFGRLQEKPPAAAVLWEQYLVMAVVFGIATQVIEQMHVSVPELADDDRFTSVFWFTTPAFAATAGGAGAALSSFTGGVSAAVVAASPPSSSSGRERQGAPRAAASPAEEAGVGAGAEAAPTSGRAARGSCRRRRARCARRPRGRSRPGRGRAGCPGPRPPRC